MGAAQEQRRRIEEAAPRVVVLHGAASDEDAAYVRRTPSEALSWHDVCAVLQNLGAQRVDAVDVMATDDWPEGLPQADLVVVNMHGAPGEDGSVQGLLQSLDVAFVGSPMEASAVGLNKALTKLVARAGGIPTPEAVVVDGGRVTQRLGELTGDVVVKPLRGGSSLGISRRDASSPWPERGSWLVERYIPGVDVTVTVVEDGGRPRPLTAVVLDHGGTLYDADVKLAGRVDCTRRPDLLPALARCEVMAADVHRLVGARDISRADFVISDGTPWFLEINTMPGLSRVSNAAESAYAAGLSYEDLWALVVAPALSRAGRGRRRSPRGPGRRR
jgi:D-alanine-D-alanine ligase